MKRQPLKPKPSFRIKPTAPELPTPTYPSTTPPPRVLAAIGIVVLLIILTAYYVVKPRLHSLQSLMKKSSEEQSSPKVASTVTSDAQARAAADRVMQLVLTAQGDPAVFAQAEELIVQLAAYDENSSEYLTGVGWYIFQAGRLYGNVYDPESAAEAQEYATQALAKGSTEFSTLYLQYLLHQQGRDESKRLASLDVLVKNHPTHPFLQMYFKEAQPDKAKQLAVAEDIIKRSESVRQTDPYLLNVAHERIAMHYRDTEQFDKLEQEYKSYAEYTGHPWQYQTLANFYWQQLRYQDAIDTFNKALSIAEVPAIRANFAEFYALYGFNHFYIARGDFESAVPQLEKAMEIDPSFGRSYFLMAAMHRQEGQDTGKRELLLKAQSWAERGLAAFPDDPQLRSEKKIIEAALRGEEE